jgi:hypothetical protein
MTEKWKRRRPFRIYCTVEAEKRKVRGEKREGVLEDR